MDVDGDERVSPYADVGGVDHVYVLQRAVGVSLLACYQGAAALLFALAELPHLFSVREHPLYGAHVQDEAYHEAHGHHVLDHDLVVAHHCEVAYQIWVFHDSCLTKTEE